MSGDAVGPQFNYSYGVIRMSGAEIAEARKTPIADALQKLALDEAQRERDAMNHLLFFDGGGIHCDCKLHRDLRAEGEACDD